MLYFENFNFCRRHGWSVGYFACDRRVGPVGLEIWRVRSGRVWENEPVDISTVQLKVNVWTLAIALLT